jgi:hypothetical protein
MVYVNSNTVGWQPFVQTYMEKEMKHLGEEGVKYLWSLFANHVENGLKYIRKSCFEPIPTNDTSLVMSLCSLLKSLTHPDTCKRLNDEFDHLKKLLDKLFVFSYVWALGGGLDSKSMTKFDSFTTNEIDLDLPKGSLFDSFVS